MPHRHLVIADFTHDRRTSFQPTIRRNSTVSDTRPIEINDDFSYTYNFRLGVHTHPLGGPELLLLFLKI